MALPLEDLIKQLEESGIVSAETLKNFIPPKASPKDGQELADELVRHKKLTRFQAEAVQRGEARSLVLGNYILLEKIGQGGMGQVFKAEHRRMKRIVAVKTLPAKTMQDAPTVARFQREVEAAAKINHPNVVAALDADEANGVHFLAMEYVDGQDLSALVKQNGPLPIEKALNYILQAARGLEAAHKRGIVHRDIKPANLLLDHEGTIKILDMGLARLHADGDESAELTSTGMIMGTADYMSPEQALDTKSADARADIYSLGCTLYFLVAGKAVFVGDTIMKRILAHREQPIPSLQSVLPNVSPRIEAIYEKMIAKKASNRYQTMAELIADLEKPNRSNGPTIVLPHPAVSEADQTVVISETEPPSTLNRPESPHAGRSGSKSAPAPRKTNLLLWIGTVVAAALFAVVLITQQFKHQTLVNEPKRSDERTSVPAENPPGIVETDKSHGVEFGKPSGSQDARTPAPANKPPEIVNADKRLGFEQPWFDDWVKQIQQMSAEEQVEAVRKKLMELNPGFDGKLTPGIENGEVTSVQFLTDHVTDLSPVKAFRSLRSLSCVGSDHQSRNGVLQDLSPLKGMSLEYLNCSINPHLADLSPIIGLPLRDLHLSFTGITDLSQLKGMTLGAIELSWTRVSSLEPLRGMRLKQLACGATPVSDLSPLKGAPLQHLSLEETPVADLSPVQSARLERCVLRASNVSDLSALRGMPLADLDISDSRVSNLEPLRGMPLKELTFYRTRVTDLSPLAGMRLTSVTFTPNTITQGTDVLREMESVTRLAPSNFNFFATSEFWKKYDAGDFGTAISPIKPITDFEAPEFQQWAGRVAKLLAEQQLEEVRKKLMELNPGFDGKLFAFGDESRPADIQFGVVVGLRFSTRQVTDISPLRALRRLQQLDCGGGVLSDLSPLRGMGLSHLSCGGNLINDLTDLKGLPLEVLDVSSTHVSDLAPLRGMKLKWLELGGTHVTDLSPLQGMPLEGLICGGTRVSDLSPLKQAMLKRIYLYRASVSDLRVLRGMPLDSVSVLESWVSDLSPLGESDLTTLVFSPTYVTKGLEAIRRMPSIRNIGASAGAQMPPAEFWKRYDAGEFGKPPEFQ